MTQNVHPLTHKKESLWLKRTLKSDHLHTKDKGSLKDLSTRSIDSPKGGEGKGGVGGSGGEYGSQEVSLGGGLVQGSWSWSQLQTHCSE